MKMPQSNMILVAGIIMTHCTSGPKTHSISLEYPETRKDTVTDSYFGHTVADPYRWLEDDQSEETEAWVKAQNKVTFDYLDQIPFRDDIYEKVESLINYERYAPVTKHGDYYYYFKNKGLQNQDVLYRKRGLDGTEEVFLDPNKFSDDGTIAYASGAFSKNDKYFAFSITESGSDWRKIIILNTEDRSVVSDTLKYIKFSGISWLGDEGIFYSRYPKPEEGSELTALNSNHRLQFHSLEDSQDADELFFGGEDLGQKTVNGTVTEDDRFLVIEVAEGTYGNQLYFRDLQKPNSATVCLIDHFDNENHLVDSKGEVLFIQTDFKAPHQRIIAIDVKNPQVDQWTDLVPESEYTIEEVSSGGGYLFVKYLRDAAHYIKQFDFEGNFVREIALPSYGSVSGLSGSLEDDTLFYGFTSFTTPLHIYMYDVHSGESKSYIKPKLNFDPDKYTIEQVFYQSEDGTEVPMFIVHANGMELDGSHPAWLYGYGGFNVSLTPSYATLWISWLEMGGVFALANIRGGGEYGEEWHQAGTRLNKQNVFDDFIAAAEYLQSEGYTSKDRTAIFGGSNGGLLVGAVMTQRPDLIEVAIPAVGVLDMLRFHKFTIGYAWITDYGCADSSEVMFEYLKGYSPLHNIKAGVDYPATLVTTADHDDRVVPAHSFKFIATLQEKYDGDHPVLIRIETKAGHGAGKPISKVVEEYTDMYAFTFYNMEINPKL